MTLCAHLFRVKLLSGQVSTEREAALQMKMLLEPQKGVEEVRHMFHRTLEILLSF